MKAKLSYSALVARGGQPKHGIVSILIDADTEEEKAILRMAYSGIREVSIYESGNAEITIRMPRGKNP